jgi:hypothetical protein
MSVLDWFVSVAAVALMFLQGWWFSRSQKNTHDYFVGGRRMHWLAVGLATPGLIGLLAEYRYLSGNSGEGLLSGCSSMRPSSVGVEVHLISGIIASLRRSC